MRRATKLLYEMFLEEARFPDEKFWDKDGNPIQAPPKKPPPGTVGRTHKDVGAHDRNDDPEEIEKFNAWDPADGDDFFADEENLGRESAQSMFPGAVEELAHVVDDVDDVSYDVVDGKLVAHDWGEKHGRHYEWDPKSRSWNE